MIMKRVSVLITICFILNLCVTAQIQRKFFNFTLGTTNKTQVFNYFKSKGKKLKPNEEDTYYTNNLSFGGHVWPYVAFTFYKNKLSVVYFSDSDGLTERNILDIVFSNLDKKLSEKYYRYKDYDNSTDEKTVYRDYKTEMSINYEYFNGSKILSLMYHDLKLQ
mgnify:CR=1 FL=1